MVRRDEQDPRKITFGLDRRMVAYTNWNEIIVKRGGQGVMGWMLAGIDPEHGRYPDHDGFTYYRGDETGNLIEKYAGLMLSEAQACKLAEPVTTPPSPFVTVRRLSSARPQASLGATTPAQG